MVFTPGLSNHLETQVPLSKPPIMLHTSVPTVPGIKYGHEKWGHLIQAYSRPRSQMLIGKNKRGRESLYVNKLTWPLSHSLETELGKSLLFKSA